jgi:hypothetical protein
MKMATQSKQEIYLHPLNIISSEIGKFPARKFD